MTLIDFFILWFSCLTQQKSTDLNGNVIRTSIPQYICPFYYLLFLLKTLTMSYFHPLRTWKLRRWKTLRWGEYLIYSKVSHGWVMVQKSQINTSYLLGGTPSSPCITYHHILRSLGNTSTDNFVFHSVPNQNFLYCLYVIRRKGRVGLPPWSFLSLSFPFYLHWLSRLFIPEIAYPCLLHSFQQITLRNERSDSKI